jgi:MFS family permease
MNPPFFHCQPKAFLIYGIKTETKEELEGLTQKIRDDYKVEALGGFLANQWLKKRANARILFSALSMHLLGSALGALVVGMLSDRFGIQTALPLSALWAGLLFFIGSFFYEKDLAKWRRSHFPWKRLSPLF